MISFDADIIAWVKGYKKGTWQIDVEGGGDLGFTDLFARSDSGAASSPAAAAWSAPTIEDSAIAESGAGSVARLVTTRAMNAFQRPCLAFWRIAWLILSFARHTVTYSPLSKPQTQRSFARGKCRRASRTRGNSLRSRLPLSTDFGNSNSSHGALEHSSQ